VYRRRLLSVEALFGTAVVLRHDLLTITLKPGPNLTLTMPHWTATIKPCVANWGMTEVTITDTTDRKKVYYDNLGRGLAPSSNPPP